MALFATLARLLLDDENPTVTREANQALLKIAAAQTEDFFVQLELYFQNPITRERFMSRTQKSNPRLYKIIQDRRHV